MSGIVGGINLRSSGLVNLGSSADGEVFTGAGLGLPVGFEEAAGGGVGEYHEWYLSSQYYSGSTGIITITSNQSQRIAISDSGSTMSLSSGVFTFPLTGRWLIECQVVGHTQGTRACDNICAGIYYTVNDSSYTHYDFGLQQYSRQDSSAPSVTNPRFSSYTRYVFDVTSTSTHKVKFTSQCTGGSAPHDTPINADDTLFRFMKI